MDMRIIMTNDTAHPSQSWHISNEKKKTFSLNLSMLGERSQGRFSARVFGATASCDHSKKRLCGQEARESLDGQLF